MVKYTSFGGWSIINLSKKKFSFFAPRGRHGPKLKIRKRAKKLSAATFKKIFFGNLDCPKGPLQHIKNLGGHFLISESYSQKGVLTARQKQILSLLSSRLKLSIKMGPNMSNKRLCMLSSVQQVIWAFTDPKLDHFWQSSRGKRVTKTWDSNQR